MLTWLMIVSMMVQVLLPVLGELLDLWLRRTLEEAGARLDAKPYNAPSTFVPRLDFDSLMDQCLAQYPVWNPLNWRRRWQIQTLRRLLEPHAEAIWNAAYDKVRSRPFAVPELTIVEAETLRQSI